MFFNTHQCNEHCQSLGLINPRLTETVPKSFALIKNPDNCMIKSMHQTLHKLCDLCRVPFETTYSHYTHQKKKGWELWCGSCTKKRDESVREAACTICKFKFMSSAYWFKMKKTDFPEHCLTCRQASGRALKLG